MFPYDVGPACIFRYDHWRNISNTQAQDINQFRAVMAVCPYYPILM